MLAKLLVRFVRPYWPWLLLVVVFQAAQSVATLSHPSLNADIIGDGVAKGDTGLILTLGGVMLGVTLLQIG